MFLARRLAQERDTVAALLDGGAFQLGQAELDSLVWRAKSPRATRQPPR